MTKTLQSREEFYLQFTDEEMAELGWEKGQKFTVECHDDGSFKLIPYSTIDFDLDEFSKDELINLMQVSCDKDISINEVISEVLEGVVEESKKIIKHYSNYDILSYEDYKEELEKDSFWRLYPNSTGSWSIDCEAYGHYLNRIEKDYGLNHPNYKPLPMREWLKYAIKSDFYDLEEDLHEWNQDKRADSED